MSDLGTLGGSSGQAYDIEPAPEDEVPEPNSMALLALGLIALTRRRAGCNR